MQDQLLPSERALKELNMPEYLRACDVVGRTTICDATIRYEVIVGDWIVWSRTGQFGSDTAHRPAGAAFQGLAHEQEKQMHEWADKILAAKEPT
jgi:hypothetical protein